MWKIVSISEKIDEAEEEEVEEEEPAPQPPPVTTYSQAMDHISGLRNFLLRAPKELANHEMYWEVLATMEGDMEKIQHSLLKQKTIEDFFVR